MTQIIMFKFALIILSKTAPFYFIYWWIDGLMDGCMHGWMDDSMNEWMNARIDEWSDGWMHKWMNGCVDAWMDGWTDRRMDGWMETILRNEQPKSNIDETFMWRLWPLIWSSLSNCPVINHFFDFLISFAMLCGNFLIKKKSLNLFYSKTNNFLRRVV